MSEGHYAYVRLTNAGDGRTEVCHIQDEDDLADCMNAMQGYIIEGKLKEAHFWSDDQEAQAYCERFNQIAGDMDKVKNTALMLEKLNLPNLTRADESFFEKIDSLSITFNPMK